MLWFSLLLTCLTVALPLIECAVECGSVKVLQSLNLITGGGAVDSPPGKWPWLVPLFRKNSYVCGSSLIHPQHLLSAAHCIIERDPENFYALLGRHNINDNSEKNYVNRTILTAFIHADYDDNADSYKSNADIALFRMNQPVQYNDYIQPVCLPRENLQSSKLQGMVVGYGYHNGRLHEYTPKQALMESIDFVECLLKHKFYVQIVSGNSFCARSTNAAPCTGDSGGGYYVKDDKTQRYTTFGIVSKAISQCEPNDYTAFVDVTKYVGWIYQKISQHVEDPPYDICSLSPCGKNAKCSTFSSLIKCSCLEGFYGEPPNCTEYQCQSHLECKTQQICSSQGKCINPCENDVCGRDAVCKPANGHKFDCLCFSVYESDGDNGCVLKTTPKPDSCSAFDCGPNARCTNNGTFATCSCLDNFIGSPPHCRPECSADTNCPTDRACVNQKCVNLCETQPCGNDSDTCKMVAHKRVCECSVGRRYSEALKICEFRPNLIEGKVETERCCMWVDDWPIDRQLPTFVVKKDSKVAANDFEVHPQFASDKIEEMDVIACLESGCRESIQHLPINLHKTFPNLLAVFVQKTGVSRVTRENFEGLKKLQWLNFYDNRIKDVDADAFGDLGELRFLSLGNNKLKKLSIKMLEDNLKLERLSLGDNQINSIPPQYFQHLSHLAVLDLFNNQLKTIDSQLFGTLLKMKELSLSGNQLETLPVGIFDELANLEEIYLDQNRLTTLPLDIFKQNKKLKEAILFGNKITQLNASIFDENPNLKYVNLDSNDCVDNNYGWYNISSPPLTREQREELESDLAANCTSGDDR